MKTKLIKIYRYRNALGVKLRVAGFAIDIFFALKKNEGN